MSFVLYRTGVRRKKEEEVEAEAEEEGGGGALREVTPSGVALFLTGVCL